MFKKSKGNAFIIKVNFEKAFDSINWKILRYIMVGMSFGDKWCKWIDPCLSASISILVNGSSKPEFYIDKGVRQGNPLLPFLFLIVSESQRFSKRAGAYKHGIRCAIS